MYKFTIDQLYNLLIGTIKLRDEYVNAHGYTSENARIQATLDTIEGLDAERDLIEQGEKFVPSQTL